MSPMTPHARTPPLPPWAVVAIAGAGTVVATLFFFGFDEPFTLRGDNKLVHFPMKLAAWQQWADGQLPAWSNGLWSGFSLLGDPTTGVWYLPHFLAFGLTPAPHLRAFDLAAALHVGWLAAGSAVLLRRLDAGAVACGLAAVLVPLASHVLGWTAYLPGFSALAWWPWVLVGADRLVETADPRVPPRALVLASIPIGAQVLAGYPELGLYSGCMAAAWILAAGGEASISTRCLRVVALGGAAALLAGPQLVPGALSALDSVRDDVLDVPAVLSVQGTFADVVDPRAGDSAVAVLSPFLGAATLALGSVAVLRRTRGSGVLAGTALLTGLLALGDRTPAYGLLMALPGFDLFRGPHKFFLFTQLTSLWLAALGFDALLRSPLRKRSATLLAGTLAFAALAEHVVSFAWHLPRVASNHVRAEIEISEAMAILEPVAAAVARDEGLPPPRIYTAAWLPGMGSLPMVVGLEMTRGGDVAVLSPRHHPWMRASLRPEQRDALGVDYLLLRGPCSKRPGRDPVVLDGEDYCLRRNRDGRPRYELLAHVRRARDFDEMEAEMRRPRPPARVSVLAPEAMTLPADGGAPGDGGAIEVVSYHPGHVVLQTRAGGDRILLIRESWSPGWTARIDGENTEIMPAAGVFFGVRVSPGSHRIDLDFEAPGTRSGIALGVGWLALAGVALRRGRS